MLQTDSVCFIWTTLSHAEKTRTEICTFASKSSKLQAELDRVWIEPGWLLVLSFWRVQKRGYEGKWRKTTPPDKIEQVEYGYWNKTGYHSSFQTGKDVQWLEQGVWETIVGRNSTPTWKVTIQRNLDTRIYRQIQVDPISATCPNIQTVCTTARTKEPIWKRRSA